MSMQAQRLFANAHRAVQQVCMTPELDHAPAGYLLAIIRDFQHQFPGDLVHSTIRDIAWLVGRRFDTDIAFEIRSHATLFSTEVSALLRALDIAGLIAPSGREDGYELTEAGVAHYDAIFARDHAINLRWQAAVAATLQEIDRSEPYRVVANRLAASASRD